MKYMGSKNRISKYILPIILKDRKPDQWYVEPFVGGGNMIDKVDGGCIGADINEYAIEALRLIRDDLYAIPKSNKDANENMYRQYKNNPTHHGLKGYYGFALSYGGKWFGGWRRDKIGKRDYVAESYRAAVKQSPNLQNVCLAHSSYDELYIPDNSIIYCDIPYANTTKYKDDFDHDKFWNWARCMGELDHSVYISEYNAPTDFICVWSKPVQTLLDVNSKKNNIERLFKYNK